MAERIQDRVPGGRTGGRHEVKCTPGEESELQKLAAARGGISIPKLLVRSTLCTEAGSDLFRREAATTLLGVVDEVDAVAGLVGGEARERLLALSRSGSGLRRLVDQLAMPDGRSRRQ